MSRRPDLHVHIERLVVPASHGARARAAIGAAIEGELARLLRADDAKGVAAIGAVDRLPAPAVASHRAGDPAAFGRAVARSVHAGLAGADARPLRGTT